MIGYKKIINFLNSNKWLFLILIVGLILFNQNIPLSEIFNGKPLITEDYAYFYYLAYTFKIRLINGGNFYNPYFYAGDLNQISYFMDKIPGLVLYSIPVLPDALKFNLYVLFLNLIAPFAMYLAARNFGLDKSESLIVAFLTILAWYFVTYTHQEIYGGTISWIYASYFCVLTISFVYKYLTKNGIYSLIFAFLFALLCFLMYAFSTIILLIPLLLICPMISKKRKGIFLIYGLSAFFILFYIAGSQNNINIINPPVYHQSKGLEEIFSDLNDVLQTIIFILGFAGIYLMKERKDRNKSLLFLMISVIYFVYAYFGSFVYIISYTYPKRFLATLILFLLIPSAISIKFIYDLLKKNIRYLSVLVILLIMLSFYKPPEFAINLKSQVLRELSAHPTTQMPDDVQRLIMWIKTYTNKEARILIEDQSDKEISGGYLLGIISMETKREFIGGPWGYPSEYASRYHVPDFNSGWLFNENITKYSSDELEEYFNIYNIKWVVVWSNISIQTFDKYPSLLSKIKIIGNFTIYETKINPNFFIKGSGNIVSDYNQITITNATKGEIVIKYKFYDKFQTTPSIKIEKYDLKNLLNDTNKIFYFQFIRVVNGNISDFKIYT